jgi:hypothetical protein
MNGYQIAVVIFAILSLSVSAAAILSIIRTKEMRFKPAWVIGSLVGWIGLGINWTAPDNIYLLFGLLVPPVMMFQTIAAGTIVVKTGFPFIAAATLVNSRKHRTKI